MPKSCIVVGGGIVGASAAFHLASAGLAVTLVEAAQPGGVATAHSFAWINASWGNPRFYFELRRRSMRGWRRLQAAIPDLGVDWCGGVLWDLDPDALDAYATEHAGWGYGIVRVDREAIRRLEPNLSSPPDMALHVAEEGMVEPVHAARRLSQAAVDAGATLVAGSAVTDITCVGDRIAGVRLAEGRSIFADETVIAAGAATADLLRTAGIALSMSAPPGLIAHAKPLERRILNGMLMAPELHVRQTRDGRLIAGTDFAGGDPGADAAGMAEGLIATMRGMLSGAAGIELDFLTVGHRPTPADGFPAIGRIGGLTGLSVAVMHSGVTMAPLAGELVAAAVADRDDPALETFSPDRPALR
jgi:glycine/D-amino acid oxidase-like deaminating enzyme